MRRPDRFSVVVFPVITGGREGAHLRRVSGHRPELIESRTFDDRLQLLEYIPTLLDGPPGIGDRPDLT